MGTANRYKYSKGFKVAAEEGRIWTEAGVMLSTLTSEEISELKDQGKVDRTCYGGGKAKGAINIWAYLVSHGSNK